MATAVLRDEVVTSYLMLRKVVGVLGMALPVVVALWGLAVGERLQPSISDYYAHGGRDVFVGILFTIAWFMLTYHGPERIDDITGNVACVCALGVALFPNAGWTAWVHYGSASVLFLALSFFSLKLFTKSGPFQTEAKQRRNRVYRACGWVMLACLGIIALSQIFLSTPTLARTSVVFWFESLALWAFGISWAVKGEVVLKD